MLLEDQLKGLGPLLEEVRGKRVLDLGCAEGLIARHLLEVGGAQSVHGVELMAHSVEVARHQCSGLNAKFEQADLNTAVVSVDAGWDIVLMLAVLHKLKEPARIARVFASGASLAVVRLPPERAPLIVDRRSGNVPVDIQTAMARAGMHLEEVTQGHYDEWTGYFRRR